MCFFRISLVYAGILALSFSLNAEKLLGGGVSITLHGIVKDRGGVAISDARVIIGRHSSPMDTVLSAKDGSFSWAYNFIKVGGGLVKFTYPYTIEKMGYASVRDTVVIDTFQTGQLVVVRDMGTITLTGNATNLRETRFSIPHKKCPQVPEAVFTVSGRRTTISTVPGTLARRSPVFQLVIIRDASNRYHITGMQKHNVKR